MGFPGGSAGEESACNAGDPSSIPGSGRSAGEEKGHPPQYSWASLVAQLVSTCSVGDLGLIPGLGRSPGERNGYPLQYSGLENSVDCIVLGVTKSWTVLSNFHFPPWQGLSHGLFAYCNPPNSLFPSIKISSSCVGICTCSPWLETLNCNSLLVPNKSMFAGEIAGSLCFRPAPQFNILCSL